MKLAAENHLKLALKREGHALIDQIKSKGYTKDNTYRLLARELGLESSQAHFSSLNRLSDIQEAVEALQRIFNRLPKKGRIRGVIAPSSVVKPYKPSRKTASTPPPAKKKVKYDMAPRALYESTLRDVAEANAKRNEPVQAVHPVLAFIRRFIPEL